MPLGGLPTGGWRDVAADAIQFRVTISRRSPLYAALAPLQPSERPAALLRLAEAGLGPAGGPALAELRRIAAAVERLAAGGGPAPAAGAGPAKITEPATGGGDPRESALDKAFGDEE